MPETSVIIRTFNEAKHLPRLFAALKEQKYRDFEIIVVDSGSYDATCDIARRHADHVLDIHQHDFTFGYSLNEGIRRAAGRYMAIISAHCVPVDSEWLGRLVAPLREERMAMVYGRQAGEATSKLGEFLDFRRTFGDSREVLTPPNFFANNANSAVRRDLWERQNFDETLPGLEDIAWAQQHMKQGYGVFYEPEAVVYHVHEETWPQVRRRYYREGQAAKWIGIRGRRHVPAEIAREFRSLGGDILWSVQNGNFASKFREILRFRFEKLLGTCSGILDGALMDNPVQRRRLLFDRTYKAVVIRGPGEASLDDLELQPLKPGEVLIRVAYQGVCATDLEILDGNLGYYKNGLAKYPIVPGHELSGVITAVGSRVSDIQAGAPVVVECIQGCGRCDACRSGRSIGCDRRCEVGVIGRDGGYAEFIVSPRRFVHLVPPGLSLLDASLCEPIAVVLKGLRRLERAWGDSSSPRDCAVVGAGTIGHLTALVLQSRGHRVTVFDRDAARAKMLPQPIKGSRDLAELKNFQTVIEATGDPDALHHILEGTPAGASILLLGLPYARREFSFETLVGYDKTVVGSVGSDAEDFRGALSVIGKLNLSAFTRATFKLESYARAWESCRERRALKTVIEMPQEESSADMGRAASI